MAKRNVLRIGVFVFFAAVLSVVALVPTQAQLNDNPNSGNGQGSCMCGVALCGCAAPSNGCSLVASCSCPSSGECTESCQYNCP